MAASSLPCARCKVNPRTASKNHPTVPYVYCRKCLNEKAAESQERRLASKKCLGCGAPCRWRFCKPCRDTKNIAHQQLRNERRKAGLCACGGQRKGDKKCCDKCLEQVKHRCQRRNEHGHTKAQEWARRSMYGLSADAYADLERQHDGHCALCDNVTKLHIDHNHKTQRVRGLLCHPCNIALGHLEARGAEWLERVRRYLQTVNEIESTSCRPRRRGYPHRPYSPDDPRV